MYETEGTWRIHVTEFVMSASWSYKVGDPTSHEFEQDLVPVGKCFDSIKTFTDWTAILDLFEIVNVMLVHELW